MSYVTPFPPLNMFQTPALILSPVTAHLCYHSKALVTEGDIVGPAGVPGNVRAPDQAWSQNSSYPVHSSCP